MQTYRLAGALLSSLSSVLALTAPVSAQTPAASASAAEPVGLEEVIVTATRRQENLQNVPVSISVITATDLKNAGVFQSSDLNNSMPNLNVQSAYGDTQPNFTLRGIGVGTEYNANAASPVGVYVDEVYQSFRASQGQQLFDMEQIEVDRGPQGTLFGRNTTGGAINFTTTKPQMGDTQGYATVGFGNYSRFTTDAALDFTPVADTLGVRLAGTFVNSSPWLRNVAQAGDNDSASPALAATATAADLTRVNTGISPGGNEIYGLRATLLYKASEHLTASLKLYASQSFGGVMSPQNKGTGATPGLPADAVTLLNSAFAGLGAGLLPPAWSPSANGLDSKQIANDSEGTALVKTDGIVANLNYRLSDDWRVVSVSDFDVTHYDLSEIDCDGTPYTLCAIGYDSESHSANQDVRLDYNGGKNKLIVGAYYGYDQIVTRNTPHFYDFLNDEALILGFPKTYWNPPGIGLDAAGFPTGLDAYQNYTQERKSEALYAEGNRELTDTLKLTLGIRRTQDQFAYKNALTTFYDLTGAPRAYTVSDYAPNGVYENYYIGVSPGVAHPLSRNDSSGANTGRIILDWKPIDAIMLYGSYSRGYRGGTYNGLAFQAASQVYFVKPEEVDAEEVGIKSRFFDNRLQFNASVFHYNYYNQQDQLLSPSAVAYLINLDGRENGLDAELTFAATQTVILNLGVGILHSEFDHTKCPTALVSGTPPQVGNCLATGAGNVDVGGNPFPYASKVSGNFGVDWKALETTSGTLQVHADTSYTGKYYYDTFGSYSYTSPTGGITGGAVNDRTIGEGPLHNGGGDYWLLNSRISYLMGRYTLAVWGKNLTNKLYYPNAINVEGSYGGDYFVRAAPLTFGAEASMKF